MISRSSRAVLVADAAALSAVSSYCYGLTFARLGKRVCPSFRAAIGVDDYATAPSVHFVWHIITSVFRICPEAGLVPLITTKEPAYFIIAFPRTCVICRENYHARSFLRRLCVVVTRARHRASAWPTASRIESSVSFNAKLPQTRTIRRSGSVANLECNLCWGS